MTWWWDRHPRGDDPDEDSPPDGRRSVYETRFAPQDDDPADRVVWVKIAELGPDGLPLPGSAPAGDIRETLHRSGWTPIGELLHDRWLRGF
jgi:hypothetical protein